MCDGIASAVEVFDIKGQSCAIMFADTGSCNEEDNFSRGRARQAFLDMLAFDATISEKQYHALPFVHASGFNDLHLLALLYRYRRYPYLCRSVNAFATILAKLLPYVDWGSISWNQSACKRSADSSVQSIRIREYNRHNELEPATASCNL